MFEGSKWVPDYEELLIVAYHDDNNCQENLTFLYKKHKIKIEIC